jgi:hypothetical protein
MTYVSFLWLVVAFVAGCCSVAGPDDFRKKENVKIVIQTDLPLVVLYSTESVFLHIGS